ncbi:sigma-54-dependent transcriptional regulator [Parapedobacter koreensis]|uniref:Two-component system, NtrC family, response regulator HydG n=1 Tax=Parapedobacter koreensis TaxID=332977 RepID=A0A1H7MTT2_9SPHI|nr:sigma-54 dependent transcriptional regulator [Parapedobacter koreensis]SEL14776.1 two-component system, NtrC family, response regulator HydG [Parapedobacter koreensis]
MANILLVEDDTTFAAILENFLKKKGFDVVVKYSVKGGIEALKNSTFHLILLDYRLGDGIGLDVVEALQEQGKVIPSIIMTSFNDVRTAVKAIRQGVFDYITKPVNPDELLMVVNEALEGKSNEKEHASARKHNPGIDDNTKMDFVEGTSAAARKLHEYIALVAPTDMSVLIRGESGTGKEYVARSVHRLSTRADKPFISIDCGTLSKELASSELFGHIKGSFTGALNDKTGQFVEASGGTLFLDEIGNLSYDVQVKLLRALQEKVIQPVGANKTINVDVRVIAATNEDLLGSGKFREDLYHRINEFEIIVPSLRDRRGDFQQFVDFFIKKANEELGRNVEELSSEVTEIFRNYDWPGNLRELKNVIKRMVLLSPGAKAEVTALPEEMVFAIKNPPATIEQAPSAENPDLRLHSEAHERKLILDVLQKAKYNKSKAAQMLNIDRKTLYNKMEKYGIE